MERSAYSDEGIPPAGGHAASADSELPLLAVDTAIKQTARGRGDVVGVTCANGNVLVATSRGFLIRYYWDDMGNERASEAEVTKNGDAHIHAVFVDPSANHVLVSTRGSGGAAELHYVHRRWPRSRVLTKFKGVAVCAVGWCRPLDTFGDEFNGDGTYGSDDSCTGPILLGTEAGSLLEVTLDERLLQQKREAQPLTLLAGLSTPGGAPSPIIGVHQEYIPATSSYVVLAATSSALYSFSGGPSLEALFAQRAGVRPVPVLEAVASARRAQLHLYYPSSTEADGWGARPLARRPSRFAWLVGSMVYHGELDYESADGHGGVLRHAGVLPLPGAAAAAEAAAAGAAAGTSSAGAGGDITMRALPTGTEGEPTSPTSAQTRSLDDGGEAQCLAMTAYHFIVLSGDQLYAVNRVSGRVVAEVGFRSPLTKSVSGEPSRSINGLAKDDVSGTMYAFSDESLYEVSVLSEGRDMWRVYLQQHDWDAALSHCSSSAQRDEVHLCRADNAFAAWDLGTAAIHYAKVVGGVPPFEDVALKFVEGAQRESAAGVGGSGIGGSAQATDALALFLSTKLGVLGRGDRAQATMVAAWLTELYLDQINRELLEFGGVHSERYEAQVAALRCFLTSGPSLEALDPGTTCSLLASYGRMEELVAYAAARGDHEAVLEYLMSHPGAAAKALAVMRKPSCSSELIYKFAPGLVAAVPEAAVDFFITRAPSLDARRLIPAMLRFGEPGSNTEGRRHVLRYVEFVVEQTGCTEPAVHNLAVALHSLAPGEAALLSYLARTGTGGPGGKPLYDVRHALRLATERGKTRACVKLLCGLGMYEDAVGLALALDLELAKAVAGMPPEEEEGMRRRLWLAVAKHVVQQGGGGSGGGGGGDQQASSIKQAVEFLREAGGLLKLEDILPFFPDFVTIDNFKDAICDSLERYNRQIEELRREMSEATQIADAARRDLKLLSTRSAALGSDHPCAHCGRGLGMAPAPLLGVPSGGSIQPMFAFPTGAAYHGACCAAEVLALAGAQQAVRVRGLLARLAKVKPASRGDPQVSTMQQQLASEVAAEDPRSGEITVRLVDLPFVSEADQQQAALWAI
ncbi:hypothetical protein FOA52_008962 [Chlamydomonas sp. UWO 241]|nr:hypothetical protein FOA52_008962 [Chlamydomonas sp. UWO 241]